MEMWRLLSGAPVDATRPSEVYSRTTTPVLTMMLREVAMVLEDDRGAKAMLATLRCASAGGDAQCLRYVRGNTVTRVSDPSTPTICTTRGSRGGFASVRIDVGCSIEWRSTTG
jgi:hypothetical protein